jgi:hypothetical protein
MKRSLSLAPLRKASPLVFEYDFETGAVTGRDAERARKIIENSERARYVAIEPHPQSHRLGPSPHSLADLAAIFGQWYRLPDWLEAERPIGDSGFDPDECDVQVVY